MLFTALLLLLPAAVVGQQGYARAAVSLSDGVLVDSAAQVAYVMNAKRQIEAIELRRGNRLWTTATAAKPLVVADGRLVAQAESQAAGRLDIVAFRLDNGVRDSLAANVELPSDIRATLSDLPGRSFRVSAASLGDAVTVRWNASSQNASGTTQGYLPSENEGAAPGGGLQSSLRAERRPELQRQGAVTLDLDTGRVSAVPFTGTSASRARVATARRPVDRSGRLLHASADGRHVLASERNPQGGIWQGYRWTVFTQGGDQALGGMSHHSATAPFVVAGNQLIYVSQPSYRVNGDTTVAVPMQVQAVNLETGQAMWSAEVSDPDYTGPIAP